MQQDDIVEVCCSLVVCVYVIVDNDISSRLCVDDIMNELSDLFLIPLIFINQFAFLVSFDKCVSSMCKWEIGANDYACKRNSYICQGTVIFVPVKEIIKVSFAFRNVYL